MCNRLKILPLILLTVCCRSNAFSQQQPFNLDPNQNYVSATMPRTPESAGFEKYGATQVNEFTGTSNIAIPIYTLKSRHLEAPITLAYQATGIRVNQEASWVGLGWDLNVGGRITREVRGSPDFGEETFLSATFLATNMQQIFNYYGDSGDNAILTPCTISTNNQLSDPNIPDWNAMFGMVQYGLGQPDIYRANFMGHSLTFYFDKTTITQTIPDINPQIKFIGENSKFKVFYHLTNHEIDYFTITDNDGVQYSFSQTETTTNSYSTGSNPLPNVSTTSWLLTEVTHPSGDNIQFTYANYGYSVPAFTMSAAINWNIYPPIPLSPNPDVNTNVSMQQPYYLTQMTTGDVTVNFNLGTRTDLYGPGSRQLNSISVVDNLTGLTKKTATFNYSFFQSPIDAGSRAYLTNTSNVTTYLVSVSSSLNQTSYIQCSNSRLRLDSVNVNDGTYEPPYRFTYNPLVVDKYSLSQDHWGYYNEAANNIGGYSFSHLIPITALGVQTVQYTPFSSFLVGNNALGNSRESDPMGVQAMILTQIVYPTGGSTQFTYELHQSTMFPTVAITGGGVRVKTIQNFAQGNLINTTTYSYSGGKYMGTIQYFTQAAELPTYAPTTGFSDDLFLKLSSNAAINFNDILIGYNQVTVTQTGSDGTSNGSVVKTFNINTSTAAYAYGLGFNVVAPYIPPVEQSQCSLLPGYPTDANWSNWLNPSQKGLPPTPSMVMEGKLMQEQYFDASNNPLKSINYYYHQVNYTNNFYDIRAIQNRVGNFDPSTNSNASIDDGIGTCGNRPVILYISPAKSYHILLDSVVATDILGGNPLTSRKYYTYDNYYQVNSEQFFNSDGTSTTTTMTHVTDYLGNYGIYNSNSTLIQAMYGANIISPVFTSTTTRNGSPVNYVNNFYSNPSSGVYVPEYTQIQIASNPTETRELYNQYDAYGHLMERQKPNGVKEDYLWGYDNQFPVASVVGSDIGTVTGLVSPSTLSSPSSDAALRTELNNLRTGLPNALVTTYTYDNVYGVTSKTDPAGHTSYFNYDPIGRLSYIQDQDLNVVKRFAYNYAGQPNGSNLLISTMLSATLAGTMPYNVTLTNTVSGQSSTYTIYPNSSPTVFADVVMDPYNISISPEYTSSTNMQLVINGNTYTGTSFNLSNINILSPTCFSLTLAPGPCGINMSSGYTAVSDGITNNGSSVSFYMAFYSSSTINPGQPYYVGTITGSCIPSSTQTLTTTSLGQTWTVTISTAGLVSWEMTSGSALSPNTTIGGSTLTYNL
jgi:YD repeat-containing protein